MTPEIVIRRETDADVGAITDVTVAAFKSLNISNHTEQFITEALRPAYERPTPRHQLLAASHRPP